MSHVLAVMFKSVSQALSLVFLVGATGSCVVLALTFWEDILTLLGKS